MRKFFCLCLIAVLCCLTLASAAVAANSTLVQYNARGFAKIWRPAEPVGDRAKIGLIFMHPTGSSLDSRDVQDLADRGYTTMGANSRFTTDGAIVWDELMLDYKQAVDCLMSQPGVETLILVGGSGGGPIAANYQNIAENGVAVAQGPEKIYPMVDDIAAEFTDVIPAAGIILRDGHQGYGFASLMSNDPSVTDEGQYFPGSVDNGLSMYNPGNGYNVNHLDTGAGSVYSAEFMKSFFTNQQLRSDRLMNYALARKALLDSGNGQYTENEPMLVPRRDSRAFYQNLGIFKQTKKPHKLLKANGDGSYEIDDSSIVVSVRTSPARGISENADYENGLLNSNINAYLSTHSIRTTADYEITVDDVKGVDWASSNTSTPWNLQGVTVPYLAFGMSGHYFVVLNEIFYDNLVRCDDKTLIYVYGASHGGTPIATDAAGAAGAAKYGDTREAIYRYMEQWIEARFL